MENNYRELGEISERPEEPSTFISRDFRLIRNLLRFLSLWRPRGSGVFERYVYPVTVNLFLVIFGFGRNLVQVLYEEHSWLSIQSFYLVHETCIWLGHIFGNYYFRSGDLDHVLARHQWCCSGETLKRRTRILKRAILISLFVFSVAMCSVFIVSTIVIKSGSERFSSELPDIHGVIDHVIYVMVLITIVYDLGIGLALSWTMGLLYVYYTTRLKGLEEVFLNWRKPCNEAVYFFQVFYSQPIKHSWKRISWWFLVNNFVAIVIPLYSYQLARAKAGDALQANQLHQLLVYLVFVLTIWLVPILVAEEIKRREQKFSENVNNFCYGLLKRQGVTLLSSSTSPATTANDVTVQSRDNRAQCAEVIKDWDQFTFASRGKELRQFIRFLKHRRMGLVARGYALQLNFSLFSLFVGILSFLIQFHGENYAGKMVTPNNITSH